ncbi:MAG TPA: VTT domain-containing protein [Candidatus Saccharimonadales bacterium]|nr:VTT domain-containing protein [Candidatus Saccharimonadales bacterium]
MDPTTLIQSGGLIALGLIIFAESGLMVGFFLPGDTLLISAGILAAQGQLNIELTIAVIAIAAIMGDNTGYQLGRVAGPRLFRKKDGIIFRQDHIEKAEQFYEKHGSKTMLFAHFIPVVRSFAPVVAGVGKMPYAKFFIFDAVGIIVWAALVTLLGYWVGSKIPNLDHYIMPVLLGVVVLTFAPTLWHIFGDPATRQRLTVKFKRGKKPADDL